MPLRAAMMLLAAATASGLQLSARPARSIAALQRPVLASRPRMEFETATGSALTKVGIGAGLVCNPIMWWSLYALKTTGCGLPAGPFGLLGAAEGISYLVVSGVVIASIVKKFQTGSGLPAGPFGLLGAVEGLSFLTAAAGLAVLGFQIADYGYVPNAVPTEGGVCN